MAITSGSRPLDDPYPQIVGPQLVVNNDNPHSEQIVNRSVNNGVLRIEHSDGSTTIDFSPSAADLSDDENPSSNAFDANLSEKMSDGDLGGMASSLIDGIDRDEMSRKDWLDTRAHGISLLGLKLEQPNSDVGQSSAPLEGMSRVRHPLLLKATTTFQATARAELLPASGPVKVRSDRPSPPRSVLNAELKQPDPNKDTHDDLAQALEKDLNHYLTYTATEYVPDTDRMLFYVGFGGDGFKKVYNCPLRRRPVSESIDAENLIVSNAVTDLYNCSRITHKIKMKQSTLRRMQILGAYRDVSLAKPSHTVSNPVDKAKEEIAGITTSQQLPEDRDYDIYEVYCELDLDEFAPKQFKGKGLPLPYRVTIEKESRQVLDVRRNWDEDDEECLAKRYFVQFPMIRGLGFYGLGYIHLLGNTTIALTAAWRLQLDNGMFANFPGFLYSKGIGRQLTNQFRIPPGGGVGLDIGAQQNIRDAVMALPYKETGPSFSSFTQHIEEVGDKLASTADLQVGEGKQDAPVGTTLALLEQASKVLDSAHKRLHASQAEEFKLLKERFKEDPEAFWRHNKRPAIQWKKDQFLQALEDCDIVPVADPNNPTSVHRLAKAMAIKELQKASPNLYDPKSVDLRIMRIADIDPEGLFLSQPAPDKPDPRLIAIHQKAQSADRQNQIQLLEAQIKAATAARQMQDKAADRESREKIEVLRIQLEKLKLEETRMVHAQDAMRDQATHRHQLHMKQEEHQQGLALDGVSRIHDLHHEGLSAHHGHQVDQTNHDHEIRRGNERHMDEQRRAQEKHEREMAHAEELHQAKLDAARQMSKVKKPAAKSKAKKED